MTRSKNTPQTAEKRKIRSLPETESFYKAVHKYNLRETAHKAALKLFLRLSAGFSGKEREKQEREKPERKSPAKSAKQAAGDAKKLNQS